MEHLEHKKKLAIMLAIMSAMLFAALNQTIVGTALPKIIATLGGMEYYSWVFTMYMLTSSVTAILVGKLSDIYGRKPFILVGIGIFTVGSFLSGLSNDIIQLIIFRGIQGLGAGLIMSTSFTAIGDLFSPRERGRWQGLMTSVFGLASVFGPTLGGWIVDNSDWHWVFWVFLPVGLIAFFMIMVLFPKVEAKQKEPIDFLGSIMITLTIVPLLLAFTWGGKDYDWISMPILSLLIGTLIALSLFIFVEKRAKSPVLPLGLFKNEIFTLSNIIGFILGFGMFGAIMYMPFFIQGVIGTSATKSGFIMMPMTISMVVASTISGQMITKTGKYKRNALLGLLIMSSGMYLQSLMGHETTLTIATLYNIIVGFGLGLSMPVFTLTVQNAIDQKLLGVATSSVQLFRQIGGTVGVGLMGTLMNNKMTDKITESAQASQGEVGSNGMSELLTKIQNPQLLISHEKLAEIRSNVPSEMLSVFDGMIEMVRKAMTDAITDVFLVGSLVVFSGFLLTFLLKEIPLRQSQSKDKNREIEEKKEVVNS
ncbi:MDR family MFS transporter [Peribacillus alkalitolerans]|uniref:MDR family MFS transporter n=1 Tax=Peribacillus alkalitolerans TaxID=1550385 RepID=UPI0013D4C6D3|nr:MDR family MFS transporter [Peribacillus alkalitolerans]